MVDYRFINDQGWKVTEYRPFSPSYAILYSPCMPCRFRTDENSRSLPETEEALTGKTDAGNMLAALTSQQLKFTYFSKDVLRQLLEERVIIRNRNRSSIQGRLTDVSGEIYGASLLRTPEAYRQKQNLEKNRLDLERQLREEDVSLWKDTIDIRRELILADKAYSGGKFRQSLVNAMPPLDDINKGQGDAGVSR